MLNIYGYRGVSLDPVAHSIAEARERTKDHPDAQKYIEYERQQTQKSYEYFCKHSLFAKLTKDST